MRGHARGISSSGSDDFRIGNPGAHGRARSVPRRRARTRQRRPSDLRRSRREIRPAGNPDRRLRAGASCLLPERVSLAAAEDMLLSGRSIGGGSLAASASSRRFPDDPEAAALAWFDKHLCAQERKILRLYDARRPQDIVDRVAGKLKKIEKIYLDELMATADAVEGLTAFIEKRPRSGRMPDMLDKPKIRPRPDIVKRAEDLFTDLTFAAARMEGRKARTHRRRLHALLRAARTGACRRRLPLGIFGGGDQLEVIHGDAYYQSCICRIPRSTIELGVSGRLDFVDGMMFPRSATSSAICRACGSSCFPNKGRAYIDLPHNFEGRPRRRILPQRAEETCHWLEQMGGKPVTDDALRASIAVFNENRRLIREGLRSAGGPALEHSLLRTLPPAARGHGDPGRRNTTR